ncbi:CIMIP2 protein CG18335-like isoform X2 [Ptiloglossa arizonensis]|uniref:CIMIP2 protein CG18335-like isoform X2 n=1 Tax=Ptiloglossa arizonensis TaxID=3350558 RepID=UPI003FA0C8E5
MSAGVELLTSAEPHLIPGYAGYVPQYRYRCGETYGSVTHKLLLDPTVNHAETLILSNRVTDDYEVQRPPKNEIDTVNARYKSTESTFVHPMVPGYEGFTPKLNARNGQRYSVLATEGLAEFERQQQRDKAALNELKRIITVQGGLGEPRNLKDRLLIKSQFKLPMLTVRPDCVSVMKNLFVDEQHETPRDHSPSPYFMNNADPKKYFINGYAGHIPYGYSHFGASNIPATNSALCDFTTNYRKRQSTEWAPASISRPDPPLMIQPTMIYHKHVGMLPNYLGHVPGETFRFGKTFGANTKDAKRWLRGDFVV